MSKLSDDILIYTCSGSRRENHSRLLLVLTSIQFSAQYIIISFTKTILDTILKIVP